MDVRETQLPLPKRNVLFLVFISFVVVACGGGGDGDDGGVDIDYDVLPEYNYTIDRAVNPASEETDGLIVDADLDGTTATLRVDPHPVVGKYQCDPANDECDLSTIDPGSFLDVYDEIDPQIVGNLRIQILEQVIIGISERPVLGRVQIHSVAPSEGGLDEGFLEVRFGTCPGDEVEIIDNGTPLDCYSWAVFEDLFETSEALEEQLASFGFQVLGFLFEQVDLMVQGLTLIGDNEEPLEEFGPVSLDELCDVFADAGLTPPDNIVGRIVPDQGMLTFSWSDVNADNVVSPGDGFLLQFDECWSDEPTDDIDTLFDGQLELSGYTEVTDDAREVITRIGFEPGPGVPPTPGGVFYYRDFTISETEVTTAPATAITDIIGIRGGISIVFSEP